ncbi:hypothetical protein BGZ76_001866, partial [Entomortierella beljakovae]
GEYANSIRWAYYGGYLDMVTSLFKSFKKVPTSVSVALIATIIASFLSVTADLGASRFIYPAVRHGNDDISYTSSTQRCPERSLCFGWSAWAFYDDNVSEVMSLVINSARNIPNRVDKRIYKPKTSSYQPICDDLGFVFMKNVSRDTGFIETAYPMSVGSCGNITLQLYIPSGSEDPRIILKHLSQNRWSFNMSLTNFTSSIKEHFREAKDELFQRMIKSLNKASSNSTKKGFTTTQLFEIRKNNSSVEVLLCWWQFDAIIYGLPGIFGGYLRKVFETTDLEDGFEIPKWLTILVSVVMVLSACIWILTYYRLNGRFTSTLFEMMGMEMVPRINKTYPVLLKARVKPFEIEGVPILSEPESYEMDDNNSIADSVSTYLDQSRLQTL